MGLVAGLLEVAVVAALCAFIWSGPLAPLLSQGLGLALFAAALNLAVISLLATLPGTIGGSQDLPAALMAAAAASMATSLAPGLPPQALFVTVAAAITIATLATGLFLLMLGRLGMGRLVRFLPYPVVGGVLASTGWLLCTGALATMSRLPLELASLPTLVQPETLLRWLPGVLFGSAMWWAYERKPHALLIPGMVLGAALLFHGINHLAGRTLADAAAGGWLLGPLGDLGGSAESGLAHAWSLDDWRQLDGAALAGLAFNIAMVPVFSAVALLLNASGMELALKRELDLNRELKAAGAANLLSGAAGGLTGYQEMSSSLMAYRLGAASRWTGLVAAAVCLVVLFKGAALLALFPLSVVGGLLVFLGLPLLHEWVWQGRTRLTRLDHAVVGVILLVTATVGFIPGVAVGVVAAVLLFVVHYSQVEVVRQTLTGATAQSRVARPAAERERLVRQGAATLILQLQGYLFFGTADRLLVQLRPLVDGNPALRFVVLDFRRVTGVDSTATLAFGKLLQRIAEGRLVLLLTEASPAVHAALAGAARADDGADWRHFGDLDRGLEWCEAQLLGPDAAAVVDEATTLGELLGSAADPADVERLLRYLERVALVPGQVLLRHGDLPDHLYLLVAGRLTAQQAQPGREPLRLQTLSGAQVVGEIGFYLGQPRTADVVADTDTVVYGLSLADLRRMECDEPRLALLLHRLIVRLLAGRSTYLADALDALQR